MTDRSKYVCATCQKAVLKDEEWWSATGVLYHWACRPLGFRLWAW